MTDDTLQRLWQDQPARKEDTALLIALLREKERGFRRAIAADLSGELLFALSFGAVTAAMAWRASTPSLSLGFGMISATLLVASAIIAFWRRRIVREPSVDASISEHHAALLRVYDSQIRFLRSVKWWYGLALLGGGMFVLNEAIRGTGVPHLGALVLVVLAWLAIWYKNDIREVRQIEALKSEVAELLRGT
jgi:hypothetical protein